MTCTNTPSRLANTFLMALIALPVVTKAQPDLVSRLVTYDGAGLQTMSAEEVYTGISITANYSGPQKNMVRYGGMYYHVFTAHDGDYDIHLRTSSDGLTWSAPVQVNDDVPGNSGQTRPDLVIYDNGGSTMVVVSWVDDRDTFLQLRTATSSDGGATFSASVAVSSHPDAVDITGNVAADGAGRLYAAWSRSDGGCIGGAWFSVSDDNGASWSTMANIFGGGCYSDQAHVMAAGPDSVMVVVSDDQFNHKNVIVMRSVDGGSIFTQASVSTYVITQSITQYISSVVDPSGRVHIVFTYGETLGTASSINYSTSTDWGSTWTTPVPVSDNALFPVWGYHSGQVPAIAVAPSSDDVYIAWCDPHASADNFEVYLTRSTDGGLTWDTDELVNLITTPLGQYHVSIALQDLVGGNANVLVTWNDDRFVVGVPEPHTSGMLVYPLPATDELTISLDHPGAGRAILRDLRGLILLDQRIIGPSAEIDLRRLAGGTYSLEVITATGRATRLVVKQ